MRARKFLFSVIQLAALFSIHYSLFLFSSCQSPRKEAQQQQYSSLSDSTTYVGMNTCRQCHAGIYETYIQTGMGKSFEMASQTKSSAKFGNHAAIYDPHKNFHYHPFWKNDSLYVMEFRLEGSDTTYRRIEKISYIVGSGQHTNSHMTDVNGYLFQAPLTFYTQKGTWDLPPGFENGSNSRFSRPIELECMSCHNGYPEIVPGSENKYAAVPNGIDCERCHGPGSEHVKQKQQGIHVDTSTAIDYSIVNPAKLPVALQMDICQRCHIQGNAVMNEGKSFFDFRPGMHLSDVMNVFMPVYKGDEDAHIMASHVERLKLSPCFISSMKKMEESASKKELRPSKNALTCITCHNPHVSVKATGTGVFNNACKNCHAENATATATNSGFSTLNASCSGKPEKRKQLNDNCVQCHMPRNTTTDIPHVITTDHYIRKPLDQKKVQQIREFVGLACINNPKPPERAMAHAYMSYFEKFGGTASSLDTAKRYLKDVAETDFKTNFRSLVRLAYLKNDFAQVVRYAERAMDVFTMLKSKNFSNEDAWTAYRIGESYASMQTKEKAVNFFQRAVDLEPYHPEFRNKLASLQLETGRAEEARKNFQLILRENPKFTAAWTNLGYLILTVDHDVQTADSYYGKALALDPDNEQALLNKAGVCIYLEKKSEAVQVLQRVLRINPKNEKAKMLLVSLKKIR